MTWEVWHVSIIIYMYKNYSYQYDLEKNWKKSDFFHKAEKKNTNIFKIYLKAEEVNSYLIH